MKYEVILKRALEKAYKGGYNPDPDHAPIPLSAYDWKGLVAADRYYAIIFGHNFAKAFLGDDDWTQVTYTFFAKPLHGDGNITTDPRTLKAWQYHIQQMAVKEEPLFYLAQFLGIN